MLLHTLSYWAFLGAVVVLYWPIQHYRRYFLLIASYIFCATFDGRFVIVLAVLTLINYLLAKVMSGKYARLVLVAGILLNLSALAFFKYTDHALLPIGVSFYTFQAISYLVEAYKGKAVLSLIDLAVYLAFFPKLIAGPLMRPAQFTQQLHEPAEPLDRATIQNALSLFLLGLIKKLLIADSLASLADNAFHAASLHSTITPLYWQGFYLYAFQIYADFSGYTDMARASAALLGFTLPENFKQPYLASTVTDFWNRWHMSLTQWFREYLFFPLSRSLLPYTKRWTPIISNLITMLLIGLWHGASWGFIAWGLFHGILLSAERLLNIKKSVGWKAVGQTIIVFHLIGVGWILFRAESLSSAANFLTGLVNFHHLDWIPVYILPVVVVGIMVFGIDIAQRRTDGSPFKNAAWVTASIIVLLSLAIMSIARGAVDAPFIYGAF